MTDRTAALCIIARRSAAALSALALLLGPPGAALAQPLQDNAYTIDLFQGPILAPLRVTGIAGAYAGYAEGIAGMVANAAAPALREPFSMRWFEWDVAASISLPIELFENNDFDNSGDIDLDYSNFVYLTLGGQLQAGDFGVGVNAELQRYSLTDEAGAETTVVIGKYHFLGGVRLLGDALVLGAGARAVTLNLQAEQTDLTMAGISPELGVLVRPDWASYRLGATFRFPVNGGRLLGEGVVMDGQVRRAGGLILPNEVVLPWELEVGLAVQVGPRPLNPAWIDPHVQERELRQAIARRQAAREERRERELGAIDDPEERARRERVFATERARERAADERELAAGPAVLEAERRARYWNWPREHLLITAELLVTGPVSNGVSLERFLAQKQPGSEHGPSAVGSSGAHVSFSPRFGIETEPIPGRVHTRFGSYYEPNRFSRLESGRVGRQHFTFGADVRVLSTNLWGLIPDTALTLQASMDFAPRYDSVSAGIGVWR
ncbi:hypothetical protein WMF27_18030 [Sorangium sp. So ce281]|uniref:hypothetical protein n=1 Tax=unclassified Sorangium TaxID=2621164 RepID=UPI003F64289D